MPTLFERATAEGIRAVAIAHARYQDSEFTHAMLRGAEFTGATDAATRGARLREALAAPGPALIYYYVPDLDVAGHAKGLASARLDLRPRRRRCRARRDPDARCGPRDGLLVTADHGMVDVPEHAQRIATAEQLAGVRHVAGEPRCLQLHLEPGADADAVAARWRETEGKRAWVATRREAIDAGWFGDVDDDVVPRIGDVLVAARSDFAFYARSRTTAVAGWSGQHGSLTPAETAVPLLRFGAFARG